MDYKDTFKLWQSKVDGKYEGEMKAIAADEKDMKERFSLPLAFGTAVKRGTICNGVWKLHRKTVARGSEGLGEIIID